MNYIKNLTAAVAVILVLPCISQAQVLMISNNVPAPAMPHVNNRFSLSCEPVKYSNVKTGYVNAGEGTFNQIDVFFEPTTNISTTCSVGYDAYSYDAASKKYNPKSVNLGEFIIKFTNVSVNPYAMVATLVGNNTRSLTKADGLYDASRGTLITGKFQLGALEKGGVFHIDFISTGS